MRLIPHLVSHDLGSQRLPILTFVAFLIGEVVLQASGLLPETRGLGGIWIPGARLLLTVVVAGLVVQQDALVGTSAFWRTRPLARPTLFASKAISLCGTLVLVPGVTMGLTWWQFGLTAGDAAQVSAAVMVEQATVVLFAVMAAIVTPTMTMLVVAGVAGVTMVSLFNSVMLPALVTGWPFVGQTLGGYKPVVYLTTVFLLGVPAIVHQFLTLKDTRTAALIAVSLLLATGLARQWPASAEALAAVDPAVVNPSAVNVSLQPERVTRTEATRLVDGREQRTVSYGAPVMADGVRDGVVLWVDRVDTRLLLKDRTIRFESREWSPATDTHRTPQAQLFFRGLNAALAPAALSEPVVWQSGLPGNHQLTAVPAELDRAHDGSLVVLTSNITFLGVRRRVVASAPLRVGARLTVPGAAFEILAVVTDGRAARVELRSAGTRPYATDWRTAADWSNTTLVLRNAALGQALEASSFRNRRLAACTTGVSGVFAELMSMRLGFDTWNRRNPFPVDAKWLAGAELVAVGVDTLGTFTRPAQVQFVMGPSR